MTQDTRTGEKTRSRPFQAEGGFLVQALQAAWPGVTVLELSIGERPATIYLRTAGTRAAMLAASLLTEDEIAAIPLSGATQKFGITVARKRRGLFAARALFTFDDAFGELRHAEGARLRIWNAITQALAPAIWTPPRIHSA